MGFTINDLPAGIPSEKRDNKLNRPEKPTGPLRAGLVLLIEDEPVVRRVMQRILQRSGFSVVVATNGAEGVELFEKHAEEIILVLSDMIMPELSGPEVATSIRVRRPDIPVLFISGYPEESRLQQTIESGGFHLLQKPFTPDALIAKVREVVERGPNGAVVKGG